MNNAATRPALRRLSSTKVTILGGFAFVPAEIRTSYPISAPDRGGVSRMPTAGVRRCDQEWAVSRVATGELLGAVCHSVDRKDWDFQGLRSDGSLACHGLTARSLWDLLQLMAR